jgi:hypothetical protein
LCEVCKLEVAMELEFMELEVIDMVRIVLDEEIL